MRSAEAILADAAILLRRVLAGLGLGAGSFVQRALEHGDHREVAARLRFQMAIVYLHVHDFHELDLAGEFLYLVLLVRTNW